MNMMKYLNLVALYVLVCVFPTCLSTSDIQWYDSCGQSFTCGTISVGFPFWGGDSRPKECGYPGLELTCEGEIRPAIQMSGVKFHVLDIVQNTSVLRIARQDLTDGLCLQKFVNTTLNFERFYYALGSQNITILYGCPPLSGDGFGGDSLYNGQFNCKYSGVKYPIGYFQPGITGPSGCYQSIFVPVLGSLEAQIGNENLSLSEAVDKGFEVGYIVQKEDVTLCYECEGSKGRCGFDVGKNNATCVCPDGSSGYATCGLQSQISPKPRPIKKKGRKNPHIKLLACLSATGVFLILILLLYAKRRLLSDVSNREREVDVEAFLRNHGSSGPKRYTYADLKKITSSFKNKLGQGGYGSVYKGQLQNGSLVAVKLMHKSRANAEEFINEVASIGNTNHVNVVKLFGFCYEGHKRALAYEFMANGSLEKLLFTGNNHHSLGLETLFQIAIGVARGLEYLHRGCNTRILHFDIKPHNILLDENFCPKISDFGLAKSCPQKDTNTLSISEARGTAGYIAPEVFLKSFGGVSHKSDVYSYGMLVLEMVGCRRKVTVEGELSSEQSFPYWIYDQLEAGEEPNQEEMLTSEEKEMQRKMIVVSLWCVKTNPSSRPAMSKVVEMLEGALDLQIPAASSLSVSLRYQDRDPDSRI